MFQGCTSHRNIGKEITFIIELIQNLLARQIPSYVYTVSQCADFRYSWKQLLSLSPLQAQCGSPAALRCTDSLCAFSA